MRPTPTLLLATILLISGCSFQQPTTTDQPFQQSTPVTPPPTPTSAATPPPESADGLGLAMEPGPKEAPNKPASLTVGSAIEFAETYESRILYNDLWAEDVEDVHVTCHEETTRTQAWGYEVVVSCRGSADFPSHHEDRFDHRYRYLLTDDVTVREGTLTR